MGLPVPVAFPTSVPACAAPPPPSPDCERGSRVPRVAAACSAWAPNGPVPAPACSPAGLDRAAAGGSRASEALRRLAAGTGRLADGQREASNAGLALEVELHALVPSLRNKALRRARRVANELEAAARSDPSLQRDGQAGAIARPGARRRARQGAHNARSRDQAARGAQTLAAGGTRLENGTRRLAGKGCRAAVDGLEQLSSAAHRLSVGLAALQRWRRGAAARALGRLPTAPTRCSSGSGGPGCASALPRVPLPAAPASCAAARPTSSTPATSSSPRSTGRRRFPRGLAGEAVNVGRGGQAARLLVVSTDPFNTAGSRATGELLADEAQRLSREGHLVTGVSGGAAILNDYGAATKSRLPLVIGAIVLITFLMLVAILRAPLLAAARGLPQPGLGRRRDRRRQPHLQDPRRLPARRPQLHRHRRRGGDLRRHLRPLDRLCRLPACPHARTT